MNRKFGLDLYRAFAILLVVFGHGNLILQKAFKQSIGIPLPDGVEFFFVLSGFLIGQIVIRDFKQGMSFKALVFFWKRRWYRTLPNYYLALVLNIIFASFALNTNNIERYSWKFWLFLQNFYTPFFGFFWESWSLSIEEWFYIILPFCCFLLLRHTKLKRKHVFAILIILLILLPLGFKIYLAYTTNVDGFWWDVRFRKTVVTRLDTIVYGVAFAFFKNYYSAYFKKTKWLLLFVGLSLILTNLIVDTQANSFYKKTFYFVVNSLGASMLLPFLDATKLKDGILKRSVTWISKISYSIYIVHFALILQVIVNTSCLCSPKITIFWYTLYWVLSFFAASLTYRYFEVPFMKLRPTDRSKC